MRASVLSSVASCLGVMVGSQSVVGVEGIVEGIGVRDQVAEVSGEVEGENVKDEFVDGIGAGSSGEGEGVKQIEARSGRVKVKEGRRCEVKASGCSGDIIGIIIGEGIIAVEGVEKVGRRIFAEGEDLGSGIGFGIGDIVQVHIFIISHAVIGVKEYGNYFPRA